MNFSELYKNNRTSVEKAITAMWCSEPSNDSQRSYIRQMKSLIGDLFAPQNAVPIVQCMNSYIPVSQENVNQAKKLVGQLWTKPYLPYEHQYKCWDVLLNKKTEDNKPKSIVVTTGTGSGKTECFMMPLIHDLTSMPNLQNGIKAIFLYPLNALMEDQKERLEELLSTAEKTTGIRLTYTVYNSDLPEMEPQSTDTSDDANKIRKRIEQVTGGRYELKQTNPNGKWEYELKDIKFQHMIYTRRYVRENPPHIILTNPTMLEYILLRGSDANLITPQSLRWIIIDETHSYTGAGAAELAMLIRRVLLAFKVDAQDIRFATSSATFGNGENKETEERELKEFIAGITGIRNDQVEIISGTRIGATEIPKGEDEERWKTIFSKEYVSLNELYPQKAPIEEKLQWLDEMCQREEERCTAIGKNQPDMKLKVHYFYRVPNNGLYVRLNEFNDGSFKIYTENILNNSNKLSTSHTEEETPLLELSRCKHCGEYVALAMVDINDWTYGPIPTDDSDMFDIDIPNNDNNSTKRYVIFGLSNKQNEKGDNNVKFRILPGARIQPLTPADEKDINGWHIIGNTQCCCPYCNTKQTKRHNSDKDIENDANGNMEDNRLQKFRLSADFISRMMAPSILDQLDKGKSTTGGIVLHDGQQYISFVDSRQAAAMATLKQNLEQERMWLYSTIYHEMCRRQANGMTKEAAMAQIMADMRTATAEALMMELAGKLQNLQSPDPNVVQKQLDDMSNFKNYMTWSEIAELLKKDSYCPVFASVFVKRSGESDEIEDGLPSEEIIDKYVQSIMVMYLSHRPASAASPETLGLFEACYPQLKQIELPNEVKKFNNILNNPTNQITKEDWQDLMQVYLDYTVRNNQSFYLRIPGNNKIDIFSTVRFATEKPRRRPVNKPKLIKGQVSQARIVRYLCALIARDNQRLNINEAQDMYFNEINEVVNAFWETLTGNRYNILQVGQRLNENGVFVNEIDNAPRFNLNNLCFKLYDDVCLCDTKADGKRHTICYRPIGKHFKNFSPYLEGSTPIELNEALHETWDVFPYFKGSGKERSKEDIENWARDHRSILWNHNIWGTDGIFHNRLDDIHIFPNIFIQQEHTAQVDKSVARELQSKFKDHKINILACSTTMEMGVDLGNLEVVMLSSVPPLPANYKQRAGRSGRNNKVRSACITLCGSDVIGLRTLRNPIEKIINRPVRVPTIDLKSPQVIQRHVNSFLIRSFGVFTDGANGGRLTQRVADYYTPFEVRISNGKVVILNGANEVNPDDLLGSPQGTRYEMFNILCSKPLQNEIRKDLTILLKGTVYEGQLTQVVRNAQYVNDRCYAELRNKLVDYQTAHRENQPVNDKFRIKLKMQYIEVLYKQLLNFWATSRFTPNANMPVDVITLDLNSNGRRDFITPMTSANPSYSLRNAIAQYTPGNRVAVDGVVYTVRGIELTNMYNINQNAYKTIYRNGEKTVIDDPNLGNQIKWSVNDAYGLEMIQPIGFMPDMNEDRTRIMENNTFTRVNAQLIDADDWPTQITEPHLFAVRPNSESGNAKILYYNEGKGYGYCFCPRCGRTVLEEEIADRNNPQKFPDEFNPIPSRHNGPNYHFAITGREMQKACGCSNDITKIKRNVIIGDLIQTDFSEIRIRHRGQNSWISRRFGYENLLFTLGVVFTQTLVDILGKERGAVDFTIMPNGHICIFDCNPGGAGYANQMANILVMKEVIKASKKLLIEAQERNSKDMLLDKFTIRYDKYIDIESALTWIGDEEEMWNTIPQNIKDAFPNATPVQTTLYDLEKAFISSNQNIILFADNDFKQWDYEDTDNGWQPQFMSRFIIKSETTSFCIMKSSETETIEEPIIAICREINAWAKGGNIKIIDNRWSNNEIYPIAFIDGNLYFMNNKENAQLNIHWGNSTMFIVRTENPITNSTNNIDLAYRPSTILLKLSGDENKEIYTSDLGQILQEKSNGIINDFINYARETGGNMNICYQDEHLKSIMGMIITLQTIGYIIKKIGSNFEIKYNVEIYKDDNGKANSITANQPSSEKRDEWLTSLTMAWIDDLKHENNIEGKLIHIVSSPRRTLTHWRVLTITCGNKRLSIYPDGGFINGWNIGRQNNGERFDVQTITHDTNIRLVRNNDIKFDIIIEDC